MVVYGRTIYMSLPITDVTKVQDNLKVKNEVCF